jgi:hypothetical protein
LKSFRRCDIRLASTVDDMYTFSQIDDHITTLIKHSHHPNMDKAKEIIDKIEHRGSMNDFKFILKRIFCLEIYRYIGNTHVVFTTDFKKVNNKRKDQNNRKTYYFLLASMQKCLSRYYQTLSIR